MFSFKRYYNRCNIKGLVTVILAPRNENRKNANQFIELIGVFLSSRNPTSSSTINTVTKNVGAKDKVEKHRECGTEFAGILGMDAKAADSCFAGFGCYPTKRTTQKR